MFNKSATLAILASLAATATAHGTVDVFSANYQDYRGADNWASEANKGSAVRQFPANTGFVSGDDIYNPSLISCGLEGHAPSPTVVSTPAGQYVNIHWKGSAGPNGDTWPHPETAIQAYMAPCDNNDCTTFDSANAQFFKIYQAGLYDEPNETGWLSSPPATGNQNRVWAGTKMMLDQGSWSTIQIPTNIPSGQYLLQHVLIAYHEVNAPQFYPACIQLEITGGSGQLPALTPAGSVYDWNSMQVDVYQDNFQYTSPGPALYGANAGGTAARRHHARKEAKKQH